MNIAYGTVHTVDRRNVVPDGGYSLKLLDPGDSEAGSGDPEAGNREGERAGLNLTDFSCLQRVTVNK